ncbi:AT-rich interactive domain-containing protein 5A isoform X2 [Oenanthe melanoleuca]|uniref:AT-rich interactive domain-containing protein 5A isoform X2 n=1 Tax=Oenanthe melanoleuca TaxID=2939378 RepID=UPI0024C111AE|nr:AT-rich interactive domain-containing protein 5A isoform X2 [Oenanthe melanoleuca]XP_056364563.1 AT-rich interactive domain-containing protein 5A isoform X2 [Oenanthe melanoleuca]
MENKQEQGDPQEPSSTAHPDAPGAGDGAERDEAVGEGGDKDKEEKEEKDKEDKDKEEEEAFLVSLYKFMKERRTPIERIPHLGFKQINLWKIYKAVEKLGAYELVTGRRLWKNVYDELGGSPGSTSAATCTRRHYERLVLPYVRHLKGEEDKPLPPSKPRRQYKVSKDDKSKRARKEKGREQLAPDKGQPEAGAEEAPERSRGTDGRSSPASPAPSPSGGCPSPCRTHSETYKRLFSSFYSKGNHPIMSPLAKKKLLAQVSKAESLHCHKRHCPEGRRAPSDSGPEAARPGSGPGLAEQRSAEPAGAPDRAPSEGSEAPPAGRDSQGCPRAEDGGAAPAVFTGYFHAYRSEGLQPGCPPLWGYFSNLKDFLEPPFALAARPGEPEQPQELRSKAGRAWEVRPPAVRGCWVPPGATFGPAGHGRDREEEEDEDDEEDEEPFTSRAVSPLAKERRDGGTRSPGGHRGLAKPKAVVATAGFAAPPPPDAFPGAALHFPGGFGSPQEQLKTRGVPAAPALPANPLLIPAFPSPLVVASELCRPLATGRFPASFGASSPRPRLYPAAPWGSCGSPHPARP